MNSHRASKLISERPGSSARVYDYANSNYDSNERRSRDSRIPKLPKRTYSLEGKKSTFMCKKAGTKNKPSATSMIPRPDWRKQAKKTLQSQFHISKGNLYNKSEPTQPTELTKEVTQELPVQPNTPGATPLFPHSKSILNLETDINKELISFKNSVLRIPEYWTDAGETVTSILKNAVTIITKQYPAADVETFEKDIESILKATDSVKRQILTRTESIIDKANQLYAENSDSIMADEDLKRLTKKISELKNEVYYRKNVFGDLLKYGNEMKELLELEKSLKQKQNENSLKESSLETYGRSEKEPGRQNRHLEAKKSRIGTETVILSKKSEKHSLQSCGDTVRLSPKRTTEGALVDSKADGESMRCREDKETQTLILWCDDLCSREKDLKDLNKQVAELNQLCKDHISKFKNFNLQIKMRGICNKSQTISGNKEVYNDQKVEVLEKTSSLACYKQDLESALKLKDVEFHNNEGILNQKKKLLNVRDELIGMLKTKCTLGDQRRY